MAIIILIYFLGGFFMDSMALIVVTIPIFYPIVQKLGFDPIWFGVIIVLTGEMGVITPPVGVNVFVIKGIAPEIPEYHLPGDLSLSVRDHPADHRGHGVPGDRHLPAKSRQVLSVSMPGGSAKTRTLNEDPA